MGQNVGSNQSFWGFDLRRFGRPDILEFDIDMEAGLRLNTRSLLPSACLFLSATEASGLGL